MAPNIGEGFVSSAVLESCSSRVADRGADMSPDSSIRMRVIGQAEGCNGL
jgi:hypothetical protein